MLFPLSAYIEAALKLARYDKLDDGSFAGETPKFKGVAAFGRTLQPDTPWLISVVPVGQ